MYNFMAKHVIHLIICIERLKYKILLDQNRLLQLLPILLSGLTYETSSGDMKRMKHYITICLLGLLLLEVS